MKAKVFLLALLIMNVFQMSAQNKNEVTLVVSAEGATKEEATKAALRSAIEQAYGAFVSANTTILDDELVKDEIVTVSNGNIKEYKEIACVNLADGRPYVTLQATISISKLISYAQSKGAETEFAGATFGANLAMYELNKKNEQIVFENLQTQLSSMKNLFDYELELKEPIVSGAECIIEGKVYLIYNNNTDIFNDLYRTTIESVELSAEEKKKIESMGLRCYYYGLPGYWNGKKWRGSSAYFRSDVENAYGTEQIYYGLLEKDAVKFVIADNISSPTNLQVDYISFSNKRAGRSVVRFDNRKSTTYIEKGYVINPKKYEDENLRDNLVWPYGTGHFKKGDKYKMIGERVGYIYIKIHIPTSEVAKYNKFEVKQVME